jgi:hypothetical protein
LSSAIADGLWQASIQIVVLRAVKAIANADGEASGGARKGFTGENQLFSPG